LHTAAEHNLNEETWTTFVQLGANVNAKTMV
jgi:hypothetical protein